MSARELKSPNLPLCTAGHPDHHRPAKPPPHRRPSPLPSHPPSTLARHSGTNGRPTSRIPTSHEKGTPTCELRSAQDPWSGYLPSPWPPPSAHRRPPGSRWSPLPYPPARAPSTSRVAVVTAASLDGG
ncbi:hypothetical protein GQ55_2G264400 [Panicum hallii var. hallii]|uniref:Uncharacterized protein n=1 Tax=Panicum hallii var. hallii TaxID=1504633 RepID=A0A2T7ESK4_9POAL|nr:hypothetical protein GQ55_2G264400 [Panicum hallii var. hallii]